uniref:Transposase Tc1-like domain-containing protein n=1 Tax=Acanthochromis polyacanthus TaxID=80966 RepID=A0A3Q1GV70_9TELE
MDKQRHLAIAWLQVGTRQSDVAGELGVSQRVISRLAARHTTTGSVGDRPRSGAPQVMDHNDDQYLRTYALRHRYSTAKQLQACLPEVRGARVSRQTIWNRLHRFGLNARRPLQVTLLTTRHRRQWSTVLFTDECRVTLHRNDGHQFLGLVLLSLYLLAILYAISPLCSTTVTLMILSYMSHLALLYLLFRPTK